VAHQRSHRATHLLGAVDDGVGQSGVALDEVHAVARDRPGVAMAAGLADHRQADLHPGSVDQPLVDGALDAQVGAAGVAHGGDPGAQRGLQVVDRLEEHVAERGVQVAQLVHVADHDVDVAVEEPRQQRLAAQVHPPVCVEPATDLHDPAVGHHHVSLGRRGAGAVEDPGAGEQGARHADATSIGLVCA
jgi:hypothetical protein